MPNPCKNKVVYNGTTLIDLTADTVTAADVAQGKTFHLPSGAPATGTATGGGVYQDEDGYIILGEGESDAPQGNISITTNGTYDVAAYAGATVDVVKTYTATISGNGNYANCFVKKNGDTKTYFTDGQTFAFTDDDDLEIHYAASSMSYKAYLTVNGVSIDFTLAASKTYTVSRPRADVTIEMAYSTTSDVTVNIVIPDAIVSVSANGIAAVGGYAFADVAVPGMTEKDLKNYIMRSSSFTSITFPSGLTEIGPYAFAGCSRLDIESIPSTVASIREYAFYYCGRLVSLTSLPESVRQLGIYCFATSGIVSMALPSSITTIPQYAFYYCTHLESVSLPSGITSIGTYTFGYCSSLVLSSLPSSLTQIDSSAFNRCYLASLSEIPSSVKSIGSSAFRYCESIESISCDGAITTLGGDAFTGESAHPMSIASASFPNLAVSTLATVFGSSSPANACHLLEFADIGSTSAIGANAFANCYALETLVLRKTASICTLANVSAFLNTPMRGYNSLTGTVYVPSALIESYKTATNWKTLYDAGTVEFLAIEGSEYER